MRMRLMIDILYFPTQKVLSSNIKRCASVVCNILAKWKNTEDRIGTKKTLTSANDGFSQNKHLQRKKSFLFIFTFVNTDICTFYQSLSGWSRFSQHGSRATFQSLLLLDFFFILLFICLQRYFFCLQKEMNDGVLSMIINFIRILSLFEVNPESWTRLTGARWNKNTVYKKYKKRFL